MVTEVAREQGTERSLDDEESKERSSVNRRVFLFKRSSSAGEKVLSLL